MKTSEVKDIVVALCLLEDLAWQDVQAHANSIGKSARLLAKDASDLKNKVLCYADDLGRLGDVRRLLALEAKEKSGK